MKTKTINPYEFDELSTGAQEKAIIDTITAMIEMMTKESPYYHYAIEMEDNHTPWFLSEIIYEKEKDSIIDLIHSNEWYFTEKGEIELCDPDININNL